MDGLTARPYPVPLLRIALLLILLTAATLLAIPTLPSVERSAAVFTGRVLSSQKVRVVGKDDSSRWELWKAEVRVQTVVTQDVALSQRVFVYYAQNWNTNYVTEDGKHVQKCTFMICPSRPRISTNRLYKFFCVRHDVDDEKGLLFIPEGEWVVRQ